MYLLQINETIMRNKLHGILFAADREAWTQEIIDMFFVLISLLASGKF